MLCYENMLISGQNKLLKKLGLNTICELPHQTFLHTQEAVAGSDITLSLIYSQEHQKLPLFMSSSRRKVYNPRVLFSARAWRHTHL